MSISLHIIPACDGRMDGRTDGQTAPPILHTTQIVQAVLCRTGYAAHSL